MYLTRICNGLHQGNGDPLIRRRQDTSILGNGITESKVKMQLSRTRAKLCTYLEQEGIRV